MRTHNSFLKNSIILITIMIFILTVFVSAKIQAPDQDKIIIQKTQKTVEKAQEGYLSRKQIFSIPDYLNKDVQIQEINKQFTKSDTQEININKPISSLTLNAEITLLKKDSLIRVILIDQNNNQYLVYEDYPLISQLGSFQITNLCEETCSLGNIIPKSLKIQTKNAKITIKEIDYSTTPNKLYQPFKDKAQKNIQKKQNQYKIDQINKNKELRWTAGPTEVSQRTFQEKQTLCKDCPPEIFYYQGGVYNTNNPWETLEDVENQEVVLDETVPPFPTDWDWRDKQGQNWVTSIKDQGSCGSCWAFSSTAAVEANVNLYFNQHLDLDLSEQDLVSCSSAGDCSGGDPGLALAYYRDTGVTIESCFPYSSTNNDCSNKCANYQNSIVKVDNKDWSNWPYNETWIKYNIIKKGVLSSGIGPWDHTMALVGWNNDIDNQPRWIWKNSWGDDWGNYGYGYLKTPIQDIEYTNPINYPYTIANQNPEIICEDNDNDGYCYWGLSDRKPSSCPSFCNARKDCDDTNKYLTYSEQYYTCNVVECYEDSDCNFNPNELQQCESARDRTISCIDYRPRKCENKVCIPDKIAFIGLEKYDSINSDSPTPTPNNNNNNRNLITIQNKEIPESKQQEIIYLNKPTQSIDTIYLSNYQEKISLTEKIKRFLNL